MIEYLHLVYGAKPADAEAVIIPLHKPQVVFVNVSTPIIGEGTTLIVFTAEFVQEPAPTITV